MIYSEYKIDPTDLVCQVANSQCYPNSNFGSGGERSPKVNSKGENQFDVQLMITSGDQMSMTKCKVWAMSNPVAGMQAGSVVDLENLCVYTGMTDDGKRFYGLKADSIKEATR